MERYKFIFFFISTVIAVVGILTPIYWEHLMGQKELEIRMISSVSLIKGDPLLSKALSLEQRNFFKNIYRFDFLIINAGRIPIEKEDYEQPINIVFDDNSKVISYDIVEKEPNNLLINASTTKNIISVFPGLLNKEDWFLLGVIVKGTTQKEPKISSHIKGVKQVAFVNEKDLRHLSDKKPTAYFKIVATASGILGIASFFFTIAALSNITYLFVAWKARKLVRNDDYFFNLTRDEQYELIHKLDYLYMLPSKFIDKKGQTTYDNMMKTRDQLNKSFFQNRTFRSIITLAFITIISTSFFCYSIYYIWLR